MRWLRRVRGALGMGLAWGVAWGLAGVLVAVFLDPNGAVDDMWVATLGMPGFVGGVVFSGVLGIAERRHSFGELSIPRFAAWGAATGLLLGALPYILGSPTSPLPGWVLALVTVGPLTLLGAASASGSLALARMADDERKALRGPAKERLARGG